MALWSGFDSALELAAGGEDVASARLADVDGNAFGGEGLLEQLRCFGFWSRVVEVWAGIPDNQIHLRRQASAANQASDISGVLRLVCDATEQNVFECNALVRTEADAAHGVNYG
jgi:hypothetical protein